MPNPDDEQTNANPPGPETAAPVDASTSTTASSDPTSPQPLDSPNAVDPAGGIPIDEPGDSPGTPELLDVDTMADADALDEPVETDKPAGMEEPVATGEDDQPEALDDGEPASQNDVDGSGYPDEEMPEASSEYEDIGVGDDDDDEGFEADPGWDDTPEEEPEPGWAFHEQPGEDEPLYDWPSPPGVQQPVRPLAWIDWRFSLLFPVAIAGAILTMLWSLLSSPETIEFRVTDAGTGEAIAGARVVVGNEVYESGTDGVVVIERPESPTTVDVAADGYYAVHGEVDDTVAANQDVELRVQEMNGRPSIIDQVAVIPDRAS